MERNHPINQSMNTYIEYLQCAKAISFVVAAGVGGCVSFFYVPALIFSEFQGRVGASSIKASLKGPEEHVEAGIGAEKI